MGFSAIGAGYPNHSIYTGQPGMTCLHFCWYHPLYLDHGWFVNLPPLRYPKVPPGTETRAFP